MTIYLHRFLSVALILQSVMDNDFCSHWHWFCNQWCISDNELVALILQSVMIYLHQWRWFFARSGNQWSGVFCTQCQWPACIRLSIIHLQFSVTFESIQIVLESDSTRKSPGTPVLAFSAGAVIQASEFTGEVWWWIPWAVENKSTTCIT